MTSSILTGKRKPASTIRKDPISVFWLHFRNFFTVDSDNNVVTFWPHEEMKKRLTDEPQLLTETDPETEEEQRQEVRGDDQEVDLDNPENLGYGTEDDAEWQDEDEQRYVQNRSSVKQVVRQKETVHSIQLTEENSSSTPDTMVEGPVLNPLPAVFPRQTSSLVPTPISRGNDLVDEVFSDQPGDPESLFVYSETKQTKKHKSKNLLKFQSPPPPPPSGDEIAIEMEKTATMQKPIDRLRIKSTRSRHPSSTTNGNVDSRRKQESCSSSDIESVTRIVFKPPHTSTDINQNRSQPPQSLPGMKHVKPPPKRPKRNRKPKKSEASTAQPNTQKEPGLLSKFMGQAWYYDTKISWYSFHGKGAGWILVLFPFIVLFGPFLMSCYIFNLHHRSRKCWHECWKVDLKYDWFNCKGKGTGWSLLLIILYIILSPLLIVFTIVTFLGLIICSVGQDSRQLSPIQRKQKDSEKPKNPFTTS
ncbi:unnamed protein product [Oikopleura dioica]|uniref:Uncharacterized protein n=1 Tax=Oikopleura dioica TaxID=34765 RepID=E4XDB1_OIKDI|nr:unnamed protein product [Oikopleura dioica]